MQIHLEIKKTLEYLFKNVQEHNGEYLTTISWKDIENYHFLLSAFTQTEAYMQLLCTTGTKPYRKSHSVFNRITGDITKKTIILCINQYVFSFYKENGLTELLNNISR